MKTEFYYNKRKYACCIVKTNSLKELRIRNESGEVLAVEQGKKFGLQGKNRESSKEVDLSQPHFYNLVKAAISAIEIVEKNHLLLEKDKIIEGQNHQINILKQELNLLNQNQILSFKQEQELASLQTALKELEVIAKEQRLRIVQLESQTLSLEEVEKKVIELIGKPTWGCLHSDSQKDLSDAYKEYLSIQSEAFTAPVTDYKKAGSPLGMVAEREIVSPFFKGLYQFLSTKNNQAYLSAGVVFDIGGITLKLDGEYTLGDLRILISNSCESFKKSILKQENITARENNLYCTVTCNDKLSLTNQRLIKQYLQQSQDPISIWLSRGQVAASAIEQIRQLRNRASHAEPILYLWQFERLWSLLVGSKTHVGVLQEIYANSNPIRNHAGKLKEGTASSSSPSNSYLGSIYC